MSDPNQPTIPAGWYPDGQGGQRWWDGVQWTEHTQPPAARPGAPSSPYGAPNHGAPSHGPPSHGAPSHGPPSHGPPSQGPPGYGPPSYGPPGLAHPGHGRSGGNGKLIALIGGGLGALLLVVLAIVVMVKVVGGNGPDSVAEAYLTANFEDDIETLCELSVEDDQDDEFEQYDVDNCGDYVDAVDDDLRDSLDEFEDEFGVSLDDIRGDTDYEVEITAVDEDDDEAKVDWEERREYKGDNEDYLDGALGGDKTGTKEGTMLLCKEDGDWKVKEPTYDSGSGASC